ncbi:MAG: acetolactate decarboxylase [Melioribacteraceae bacterium]|jgi:acetolactate decarboxylase|nr:acetolactate decarboxylase [Melioribacteraceae bacterium]
MKIYFGIILLLITTSCVNEIENNNVDFNSSDNIFQYSSKNGLLNHDYVGDLTLGEIKENGNFGLGTFNMVDGEMVIFDGNVYQVLTNGEINNISSDVLSPFVVTKFFNSDTSFSLPKNLSLDSAKSILAQAINNSSNPLAIKITGKFNTLKSRSVDKVANESVSLDEIVANQTVFDFTNVEGSVIGFWYPDYFDGVNFPGFHLHVLLNDLSGGGHLLDCSFDNATVEIDYASGVNVEL